MSLNTFVPRIWGARLLENLHKAQVFAGVVNHDYEGDIKAYGDQVQISAIGPVTGFTYTKNTDMSTAQVLDGASTILNINQAFAYNFAIDDIDKRQQQPKLMNEAMKEAAYIISNDFDTYIAGLYTDGAITGTGNGYILGTDGTPITVSTVSTDKNAFEVLIDLNVALDTFNVPDDSRWVVVPPWFAGLLVKDVRFSSYGTLANRATALAGEVGNIGGFRVFKSNNVKNTTDTKYKIMAGYDGTITAANNIVENEAFRNVKQFGDIMRGLHVYGVKVVRPSALAVATCNHV